MNTNIKDLIDQAKSIAEDMVDDENVISQYQTTVTLVNKITTALYSDKVAKIICSITTLDKCYSESEVWTTVSRFISEENQNILMVPLIGETIGTFGEKLVELVGAEAAYFILKEFTVFVEPSKSGIDTEILSDGSLMGAVRDEQGIVKELHFPVYEEKGQKYRIRYFDNTKSTVTEENN